MAGEVRKGVVRMFGEAVSHVPVFGPVGQPHQLFVPSIVSVPRYVAPAWLPVMSLMLAMLVEMVPAN